MKKVSDRTFSSRSFGLLISLIFFIFAIYPILQNQNINLIFLALTFITLIISIFYQKLLDLPAFYWFKLGLLLHKVISPIILFFVYFISIIFVGLLMKIFGNDPLEKKFNKNNKSYWIRRKKSKENEFDLDKQF